MLDKAKKIVLSASVVVLFALYAVQQRQHGPVVSNSVGAVIAAPTREVAARVLPTVKPVATLPMPTAVGTSSLNFLAPTEALVLAPTETPMPTVAPPTAVPATSSAAASGNFRNGTYTGSEADANWGFVQVQVVITKGQISNVQFLEYPNDRSRSRFINSQAMPLLTQEAITSQQANVDIVSGATDTSQAFIESLSSALRQATA